MNYLEEANKIYDDLVSYRRTLHENPEVGFELPKTIKFITERLTEWGIDHEVVEDSGVVALLGQGEKVVLLRMDMDALPIKEESGEDFASTNGNMHACGHDFHATMLLGAAKLLKENEAQLKGQVKLLFQPAEELLIGGDVMVKAGVLENPKVDVALSGHVNSQFEPGFYVKKGVLMASANNFRIKIKGHGSHGAFPSEGVDPVNIGAHIVLRSQEIMARELPLDENVVLTMGRLHGDGSRNVIPEEVTIEGTMRSFDNDSRDFAKERLVEIVEETARTFRGEAHLEYISDVPVLITDDEVTEDFEEFIEPLAEEAGIKIYEAPKLPGSEDFAYITHQVPSAHFWFGNPHPECETRYALHHPKVRFDERPIPVGVAALAEFATKWLNKHSK